MTFVSDNRLPFQTENDKEESEGIPKLANLWAAQLGLVSLLPVPKRSQIISRYRFDVRSP